MKVQVGGPGGGKYSREYLVQVPVGYQLQIQVGGPPCVGSGGTGGLDEGGNGGGGPVAGTGGKTWLRDGQEYLMHFYRQEFLVNLYR